MSDAPPAHVRIDGKSYIVPHEVAEIFLAVSLERDELKVQAACPYEHVSGFCNKCGWSPSSD